MVASLAKGLVRLKCYKLAGLFLTAASFATGRRNRISYNKKGFWTHKRRDWVINEAFPDIRMDIAGMQKTIDEIYFHDYKPAPGNICIDVGAGIGTESLFMSARLGRTGKVYAIEAAPLTFAILEANVSDNRLENIRCYQLAISDTNGRIKISSDVSNHIANSVFMNQGEWVEAVTMDEFIDKNNIDLIDYVKVNIEGAEKLLIKSFTKVGRVRYLAISCHDFLGKRLNDDTFFTREAVTAFMVKNNFSISSRNTGVDYVDDWIYGINRKLDGTQSV